MQSPDGILQGGIAGSDLGQDCLRLRFNQPKDDRASAEAGGWSGNRSELMPNILPRSIGEKTQRKSKVFSFPPIHFSVSGAFPFKVIAVFMKGADISQL